MSFGALVFVPTSFNYMPRLSHLVVFSLAAFSDNVPVALRHLSLVPNIVLLLLN